MSDLISIGKILNFHGIKDEVKIGFTKGKDALVQSLKKVYVKNGNDEMVLTVSSVRFHKQFALIKFKEINSIDEVEAIKGLEIKIPKSVAEEQLQEDEFFVSDLVGMSVVNNDGEKIGYVKEVGSNGASEILEVVDANEKKHLIPFVKALVPVVDVKNFRVVINDIEGLIE